MTNGAILSNPRRVFGIALVASLVIKLALAALLPMSGDEAYFIVWAKHPDLGYYDHTPMVGWFLQLLLYFGDAEVILRLPAILLATIISIGLYRLLGSYGEDKAALVALLFLITPLNLLNVLVTTDTPLILFAFLSGWALHVALQRCSMGWYALSGVLLGLAFLSKYFAVLLGLAYLAAYPFLPRDQRSLRGYAVLFVAALPFGLVNLYWNCTHCWDNILFNAINRHEGDRWSLDKVAFFWGAQLYLMTPPVVYYLFRRRAELKAAMSGSPLQLFGFLFLLPMGLFALLSFMKAIGMHWVLSFYPFLYVLLFVWLSREELAKTLKFMLWFSGVHLALVVAIISVPLENWKQHPLYGGAVLMIEPEPLVEEIRAYERQGAILATNSYSISAIMAYHYGKDFSVFGEGSRHARQDDMLTDFRALDGKNILILRKSAPDHMEYMRYFRRLESRQFELRGATYHFVLGYDFDYLGYRDSVLRTIRDKYYRIPSFLPHAPCYFCEKYFQEEGGC